MLFWINFIYISILLNSISPIMCQNKTLRIANGTEIGGAKFVVSIRINETEGTYFGTGHRCMGSILSDTYILTSANCMEWNITNTNSTTRVTVVAGTPNRLERTAKTQIRGIEKIIIHPKYVREYSRIYTHIENDLALIKLNKSLKLDGKTTAPLKLDYDTGSMCTIGDTYGWGSLYYKGPYADELVESEVQVERDDNCLKVYPFRTTQSFCVSGSNESNIRFCHGDEGAPFICGDRDLKGILSYGFPQCELVPAGSLFTDIEHYIDWIKEVMRPTGIISKKSLSWKLELHHRIVACIAILSTFL